MAHIEDRWYRTKRDANGKVVVNDKGKPVLVPSARHGKGDRYRLRFVDLNGEERSQSYPDGKKKAAQADLADVESDKRRGRYISPSAGDELFRDYAEGWLRTQTFDASTRETTEIRVRKHLYPFFGARELRWIKPGRIREWDASLVGVLAVSTRSVVFSHLRSILGAAVDDELIPKNPCAAKSVNQPKPPERRITPWASAQVSAIRGGLPERYRPVVDLGAGCGLRQGEAFGISDADLVLGEDGWIDVQRQVKRVRSRLVFGLPKNDRPRRVPMSPGTSRALERYMASFPPVEVTLPWEDPDSDELVTVRLLLTTTRKGALNRSTFNAKMWYPALRDASIPRSRATGVHALRHFYASTLLDAGENIKALSVFLGHHDPGFTLRIYTHLLPTSAHRTRHAIDSVFPDLA